MSDLLNKASLVVIPSGYKEDTVYSVVPSDGSGDLSFTRASNGTRINSAGLVEVTPWNLLEYSEDFSTVWLGVGGLVVTTNTTTAPNGTTTADTLNDPTSGSFSSLQQNIAYNQGIYTFSIYVKKTTGSLTHYPGFEMCSKGTYLIFNTSTGTYVEEGGTNYTVYVESIGDYYRISITTSTNGGTQNVGVWPAISTNGTNISSSATGSNVFWGAQLNIGTTAKPYFPTTDRLNVPRLTYQNGGGGCPSLLLEKQSTNLALQSNAFNTSPWTTDNSSGSNPVITPNYGISPDGTQNAVRIELARTNVATSYSIIYQYPINVTIGQSYTWSVWLKSLSGTPTISIIGDFGRPPVTLTSEWVRYTGTGTATASQTQLEIAILGSNYATGNSLSADFLAYGYQIEQSSYPTSYIPTTTASATRVADLAYKTSATSLIGQTEGVLFCDFNLPSVETSVDYPFVVNMYDSLSNRFGFARYPNGGVHVYMVAGGSSQFTYNTTQLTGRFKLALGYKANDCVIYLNGTLLQTITSGTIPATSQIIFNDLFVGGGFTSQSQINQAVLFKTRLTNAELASLTTI